jgi:hypothetical protein
VTLEVGLQAICRGLEGDWLRIRSLSATRSQPSIKTLEVQAFASKATETPENAGFLRGCVERSRSGSFVGCGSSLPRLISLDL